MTATPGPGVVGAAWAGTAATAWVEGAPPRLARWTARLEKKRYLQPAIQTTNLSRPDSFFKKSYSFASSSRHSLSRKWIADLRLRSSSCSRACWSLCSHSNGGFMTCPRAPQTLFKMLCSHTCVLLISFCRFSCSLRSACRIARTTRCDADSHCSLPPLHPTHHNPLLFLLDLAPKKQILAARALDLCLCCLRDRLVPVHIPMATVGTAIRLARPCVQTIPTCLAPPKPPAAAAVARPHCCPPGLEDLHPYSRRGCCPVLPERQACKQ